MEPLRELLSLYLRQELGTAVVVAATHVIKRRHDYAVLKVQLHHPFTQVIVKLAGPDAAMACPFDRTAALHRLVAAQTTIPIPEVIAIDTSCRTWPWRILVRRYCPGQEWAGVQQRLGPDELGDAARQIGDAVSQLHAIRFEGFGELDGDGQIAGGTPYLAALGERSGRFVAKQSHRELFLSVVEQHAHLFQEIRGARLCHEDLHKHNILFRQEAGRWRLATILDFDKAWAGHHEIDLARLELWVGMTSREFWQAYEAVHPLARTYPERRPIYQLLWCLEFAQPTEAHLAVTRRVCDELGIPPVDDFNCGLASS